MGSNPFIGGNWKQRKGMQKSPERPDRVEPVPEQYEGENLPYRGIQTHGVTPQKIDHDAYYTTSMWDDGEPEVIDALPEEKVEEPVPVYIVQREGRERLDWRAGRFFVQSFPQEIRGRLETRRSVQIRNHSQTASVYLGPDSGITTYSSFRLEPGKDVTFFSTENIYVVSEGDGAEVSWIEEYAVKL